MARGRVCDRASEALGVTRPIEPGVDHDRGEQAAIAQTVDGCEREAPVRAGLVKVDAQTAPRVRRSASAPIDCRPRLATLTVMGARAASGESSDKKLTTPWHFRAREVQSSRLRDGAGGT